MNSILIIGLVHVAIVAMTIGLLNEGPWWIQFCSTLDVNVTQFYPKIKAKYSNKVLNTTFGLKMAS